MADAKQKEDSQAMIQLLKARNLMTMVNMNQQDRAPGQISDRVRGPVNIEWTQNKSTISREFYTTMFWNGTGNSIWVFWAGGESGGRTQDKDGRLPHNITHCSLGCPRRFAFHIPEKLTFKEDGTLPDELSESFQHCVVKMGFASFTQDTYHMYLVVLPDEYKCHQHRFSGFVKNPALLYGMGAQYGESSLTSGVGAAVSGTIGTLSGGISSGLTAAGASAAGATVGTTLIVAGVSFGITFAMVKITKAVGGHELHYVTLPTGEEAFSMSIDINLDKSNKQGGTMVGKKDIIWI